MASTTRTAHTSPREPEATWLIWLDRNFRLFGKVALALLLATAGLLAAGIEAWRGVFALAHLAALIALLPLGVALVVRSLREAGGVGEAIRRYRLAAALVTIALVAIVLSLANFDGGNRVVRRAANLTTVGIVLVLVWRYLLWSREHLRR